MNIVYNMERESGYYWVKYFGSDRIAFYSKNENLWSMVGMTARFRDEQLDDIGKHKLERKN
jgi:hypothetical protein